MNKKILDYVYHYIDYEISKSRHVDFISSLKSLSISSYSFYFLTMNFITDLSLKNDYNIILVIVDRFSKRVIFKTEKKIQITKE